MNARSAIIETRFYAARTRVAEYLELTKPLYARRRALIHATDQPTAEELEAGAAQSAKDDADENPLAVPSATAPAAVPDFWLTALRNHVGLSELITDRDAGARCRPQMAPGARAGRDGGCPVVLGDNRVRP